MGFKGSAWFLRSLIITGQLLTTPAIARSSHSDFRHLARHLSALRSKPAYLFVPRYIQKDTDIGKGPYYAIQAGFNTPLIQSQNFDPGHLYTAASHTKLLTALCVLDAMKVDPRLNTERNMKLLREALLASNNDAAQEIARIVSPEHTDASIEQMLKEKAAALSIGNEFIPANASGLPDQDPRAHHDNRYRHDSLASAHATNVVAFKLAQDHLAELRIIYENTTRDDNPTNNLFWPLLSRGDPKNSDIFMFCKTGSDKNQSRSTEVVLITKEGLYSFFHFHARNDPRDPIAGTAALIISVINQNKLTVPKEFTARLEEIAKGSTYIGPALSSTHFTFAHHIVKEKAPHSFPVRHIATLVRNVHDLKT